MSDKMEFRAEVHKMLDIVINSLYSEKQIFLRELISNASDACDKLKYMALTNQALMKGVGRLEIKIVQDHFENETDFDLIDAHIWELKSLEVRYDRAIRQAKIGLQNACG